MLTLQIYTGSQRVSGYPRLSDVINTYNATPAYILHSIYNPFPRDSQYTLLIAKNIESKSEDLSASCYLVQFTGDIVEMWWQGISLIAGFAPASQHFSMTCYTRGWQ